MIILTHFILILLNFPFGQYKFWLSVPSDLWNMNFFVMKDQKSEIIRNHKVFFKNSKNEISLFRLLSHLWNLSESSLTFHIHVGVDTYHKDFLWGHYFPTFWFFQHFESPLNYWIFVFPENGSPQTHSCKLQSYSHHRWPPLFKSFFQWTLAIIWLLYFCRWFYCHKKAVFFKKIISRRKKRQMSHEL